MFENAYREIGQTFKIQGIDDDQADVKSFAARSQSWHKAQAFGCSMCAVLTVQAIQTTYFAPRQGGGVTDF